MRHRMRREPGRKRSSAHIAPLCGALVLLVAPAAFADKANVCVDPDSSKCLPTIQEGIDAAEAGQLISIAKGEYQESVVVDKVALRLEGDGQGKTILRGPQNAPAIQIVQPGVEISKMTIRGANGPTQAVEILATAPSSNMAIDGVILDSIDILDATGQACLLNRSKGLVLENSRIGNCDLACVVFSGQLNRGATIRKNEIGPCRGPALNLGLGGFSDNLIIDKNEISGADGACIQIVGSSATVTRNEIQQCDGEGIKITGDDPVVENNEISGTVNEGILQQCTGASGCTRGSISKNHVENAGGPQIGGGGASPPMRPGISVRGGADGSMVFVVEKNSVEKALGSGIYLQGGRQVARKNKVSDSGTSGVNHCFQILDDFNLLEDNKADKCSGNGFLVSGSQNTLNKNKASKNIKDGFEVGNNTLDNTLNENQAKDNGIYGFEVFGLEEFGTGATNTVLNDDKASGNQRADLCNAGVNTTINGGKYKVTEEGRDENFFGSCYQY